jgi:hypothetical protein
MISDITGLNQGMFGMGCVFLFHPILSRSGPTLELLKQIPRTPVPHAAKAECESCVH